MYMKKLISYLKPHNVLFFFVAIFIQHIGAILNMYCFLFVTLDIFFKPPSGLLSFNLFQLFLPVITSVNFILCRKYYLLLDLNTNEISFIYSIYTMLLRPLILCGLLEYLPSIDSSHWIQKIKSYFGCCMGKRAFYWP